MKDIRFVFDDRALPNLIVLCRGQVAVGDRLFNRLPTEADGEPSFTVEKIAGEILTVRLTDQRRKKVLFRSLNDVEWEQRFS